MEEKNLRDELAMSMPMDSIPVMPSLREASLFLRLEHVVDEESDMDEKIPLVLEYQAKIRYMYADAMLKARNE